MSRSCILVVACPTCGVEAGSPCVTPVEHRIYGVHAARFVSFSLERETVLRWAESKLRASGNPNWRARLTAVKRIHEVIAECDEFEDQRRAMQAFQEAMEAGE